MSGAAAGTSPRPRHFVYSYKVQCGRFLNDGSCIWERAWYLGHCQVGFRKDGGARWQLIMSKMFLLRWRVQSKVWTCLLMQSYFNLYNFPHCGNKTEAINEKDRCNYAAKNVFNENGWFEEFKLKT